MAGTVATFQGTKRIPGEEVQYGKEHHWILQQAQLDPSRLQCDGYHPWKDKSLYWASRRRYEATLSTQGGPGKRDYSQVTCFTCNKKGHISRFCQQHMWN